MKSIDVVNCLWDSYLIWDLKLPLLLIMNCTNSSRLLLYLQGFSLDGRVWIFSDNWCLLLIICTDCCFDDVVFNNEYSVVQRAPMIVLLSSFRIFWSLVLNCSRTQELSEIVSVETANLERSMFFKEFLLINKLLMNPILKFDYLTSFQS